MYEYELIAEISRLKRRSELMCSYKFPLLSAIDNAFNQQKTIHDFLQGSLSYLEAACFEVQKYISQAFDPSLNAKSE